MFQMKDITKLLHLDRSFLHYYDEIGIIVPKKNDKNYRQYTENDLMAIASAKFYRSMDMHLKNLAEVLLESGYDERTEIMHKQQAELLKKAELYKDLAEMANRTINIYDLAYGNHIKKIFLLLLNLYLL